MNNIKEWDQIWGNVSIDNKLLENEMELEYVRYIKFKLFEEFKTLEGFSTIELGSGLGRVSLGLSLHGTDVTLVDNSMPALDKAKKLFNEFDKKPTILNYDLLKLADNINDYELKNKYDICMSFGLLEHFIGSDRKKIIDVHFELLRPGGICIISVPNCYCPSYQLWMKFLKLIGKWKFGLELPYTKHELKKLINDIHITEYNIWTTSFLNSINHFSLEFFLRSVGLGSVYNNIHFPEIRLGFIDEFGYALVLFAKK